MKKSVQLLWLEAGDRYTVQRGIEAGTRKGIRVESLDVLDLTFSAGGALPLLGRDNADLTAPYDGIIIRCFMPFLSEVLTIARFFRDAGKVVVDRSLTDEGYALSKMHDYLVLSRAGIGVPLTYQCFDLEQAEGYAKSLGYPCILKGVVGSQGRNVFLVNSRRHLRELLWRRRPGEFMVQEFLAAEVDYRVMTVGYQALPVMVRRKPPPGEFRTNFEFKEVVTGIATDQHPAMKKLAEEAARTLRREFCGVDIRHRGTTPLVLEANRRPGFKGFEEATRYDVASDFIEYVQNLCVPR
jgi:RimK family alpha-L-glutamate ligase